MISKNDMIEHFKRNNDKGYHYDEDTDSIVLETDNLNIPMDSFLEHYKKKTGQSFECIYDFHVYCMNILRCTECGTVVRYYYDEGYDPNFRCPTCTNYKTHFEYWTKEKIKYSLELQEMIEMYEKMAIQENEQYKRIKARGGLQDWELSKKEIHLKKTRYSLHFNISNITNKNKLKGLRLEIQKWNKDGENWRYDKKLIIPLSVEQLFYQLFYKNYLKKHPEENPLEQLKGKPLYETMEEQAKIRSKYIN